MSATTQSLCLIAVCILIAGGCQSDGTAKKLFDREPDTSCGALDTYRGPSLSLEQPSGILPDVDSYEFATAPLDDFNFDEPGDYHLISLEECIYTALQTSPVIRELGGAILRSPDLVSTIQDPALVYSDPRFGEEAALSAFDANLNGQFIFQNNDRAFNNSFLGDNGFLQQNLAKYRTGLSKRAATGARFEFNHVVDYDLNNSPSNRFSPSPNGFDRSYAYDTYFEAGFRQPLFQGAGVDYNRIAGPNNSPGVNNGVLIARANTDMSLAEFEIQLRNLVSNVENAYWDLYYAYRDLESRIEARDGAYKIWENTASNDRGAAIVNQAKEQYYRFASEVENAIYGRLSEGTRTNNGSSAGTFRANPGFLGVRVAERRLRLITGMPINTAQLAVPSDRPTEAEVVFDWYQSKNDALVYRPELRRQRWRLKRRQLEQIASRNHLLPRVDVLGKYRLRGFGENLFGESGFTQLGPGVTDVLPGSSATASLLDGDLQEWELGFDVNVPIGFRQAHAALRNAELAVARESSILREQERQIIYGLSNALGDLKRSMRVFNVNQKRVEAAEAQYKAVEVIFEEEDRTIDQLLEAQRRVIEAKTQYFQSQVEHMLALRSVHFEKGTLFRYHNVLMTESAWADGAQKQANQRDRWKSQKLNYYFPGLQIGKKIDDPNSPLNPVDVETDQFGQSSNELGEPTAIANSLDESETSPLMTMLKKAEIEETKNQEIDHALSNRGFPPPSPGITLSQGSPRPQFNPNKTTSISPPATNLRDPNRIPIIQGNSSQSPTNLPGGNQSFKNPTGVSNPISSATQQPTIHLPGFGQPPSQPTSAVSQRIQRISNHQANSSPTTPTTPRIPAQMSTSSESVAKNLAEIEESPNSASKPISSRLGELSNMIGRVTEKAVKMGADISTASTLPQNPAKIGSQLEDSTPLNANPIPPSKTANSIPVSDAGSTVGDSSRRTTSDRR